jgi:hypothetical protein
MLCALRAQSPPNNRVVHPLNPPCLHSLLAAANSAAAARTLQLFGKGAVAPAAVQPVVVQAAYAPQPVVTYSYATAPVVVGAVYPQAAPVNKVHPVRTGEVAGVQLWALRAFQRPAPTSACACKLLGQL